MRDQTETAALGRARSQRRKIENQQKGAWPAKINGKNVFSDLRNPSKSFTPLFGDVKNQSALTENEEQWGHNNSEIERCVPENI